MFEYTKKFCDAFPTLGLPGFDLIVYHKGKCVLRHMGGYSDLENKIPVDGTERYNIYSCSKVITCTAALMLYERGLFSLEDELYKYLPEFENMTVKDGGTVRPAKTKILIKHLFEMTAGFSYDLKSKSLIECYKYTDGKCQTREVMRYLAKEPLEFDPGDRWSYSLCHDVLAGLVEVVSGEKFETFVKKNIFDPIGMTSSSFLISDDEAESLASQYLYKDGKAINIGKRIYEHKLGDEYASGGAGAVSTVEDYIKFLEALRTHKLLSLSTLELMTAKRLTESQEASFWDRSTHSYALGVRCPRGVNVYTDFGWSGAASSYLAIDTKNEISMFFAAQMISSPILPRSLHAKTYRFVRAELVHPEELEDVLVFFDHLKG